MRHEDFAETICDTLVSDLIIVSVPGFEAFGVGYGLWAKHSREWTQNVFKSRPLFCVVLCWSVCPFFVLSSTDLEPHRSTGINQCTKWGKYSYIVDKWLRADKGDLTIFHYPWFLDLTISLQYFAPGQVHVGAPSFLLNSALPFSCQ